MLGYSETIRRWATDIRRAGALQDADGVGEVGLSAEERGRRLAVRFMLKVNVGRVTDARYEVFGCGYSMAACAIAADLAVGYTLREVRSLDADFLNSALEGLPEERRYCAELAAQALQAAAQSAMAGATVRSALPQRESHGPRVTKDHPVYALLMQSPQPDFVSHDDRHLFACLISVAAEEPCSTAAALGVDDSALKSLLLLFFPGVDRAMLAEYSPPAGGTPPVYNPDIFGLLLSYVETDRGLNPMLVSLWLAQILATRSALSGHLWMAMGLTERPQLSAAIRRHLPGLAEANSRNMRWKRFLFKQLCDRNGGTLCKAPNCGVCSDYHLCFTDDGE